MRINKSLNCYNVAAALVLYTEFMKFGSRARPDVTSRDRLTARARAPRLR